MHQHTLRFPNNLVITPLTDVCLLLELERVPVTQTVCLLSHLII